MRQALMMPTPRSSIKWRMFAGKPTSVCPTHSEFHRIVRYQTMSSFDQLNGSFTLTDTAFAQQQDAFAVNLHQNTVAGDARCKVHLEGWQSSLP